MEGKLSTVYLFSLFISCATLAHADQNKLCLGPVKKIGAIFTTETIYQAAVQCVEPIKPVMTPIKPAWCKGRWYLELVCDVRCNCVWQPTCD